METPDGPESFGPNERRAYAAAKRTNSKRDARAMAEQVALAEIAREEAQRQARQEKIRLANKRKMGYPEKEEGEKTLSKGIATCTTVKCRVSQANWSTVVLCTHLFML